MIEGSDFANGVIEAEIAGAPTFDQRNGVFHATVRASWCRTSLEAREGRGEPPRLMANGKPASADWWRSGTRGRLLALSRLPPP